MGIGQMQNYQSHGAKLVISEILMSISECVIIVLDCFHGTKDKAFTSRIWQSLIISEQVYDLPNFCSGESYICTINT